MLTRLRQVAAFALLGLCFAVIALWIRSYQAWDGFSVGRKDEYNHPFFIASREGVLELATAAGPEAMAP